MAAGGRAGEEKHPYLVMGHGIEDIKREAHRPLPENVVLVTLTVCGNSTTPKEVCPFIDLFFDPSNKELLSDPITNKKRIESTVGFPIRVYPPGSRYPFFAIKYFTQMKSAKKNQLSIYKSGIYEFPIREDILDGYKPTPKEIKDNCNKFYLQAPHIVKEQDIVERQKIILNEIYKGSIYPRNPPNYDDIANKSFDSIGKLVTIPFDEAIDTLPKPSVFYYVICRAPFISGPKNVYKTVPSALNFSKRVPGAENISKVLEILKLNNVDFPGMKELRKFQFVTNSENNTEEVSEEDEEFAEFLNSIEPIESKNEVEIYKDAIKKIELVKSFDKSKIKNETLRNAFSEYQNAFLTEGWQQPTVKSNILESMIRRRALSNIQQETLFPSASSSAIPGGGGRKKRKTMKKRRNRKVTKRKY